LVNKILDIDMLFILINNGIVIKDTLNYF